MTDTTTNVPAVAVEQKFTAVQVEGDCPRVLCDLGKQIAAHMERARKSEEKAEQHRIAAGQLLSQVIESCDAEGFDAFLKKFCPDLGRSRVFELKSIAAGKKSLDDVRAATRDRVSRHRAKKTSPLQQVTDSVQADKDGAALPTGADGVQDPPSDTTETEKTAQVTPGDPAETAQVTPSDTTEITQVMQDGTAETAAPDGVVASTEGAGDDGATADPTPPAPAPNRAATAATAVNGLSGTELQDFLDRLWPAPRRAFELKFGARTSVNTNDEIATLAGQCSILLSRPQPNIDDIHKKLARIKRLTGSSGKARAKTLKSNAQLDRGAFARGMGMAGPTGEKFPTMQMEPTSTDASGNTVFAQPRGNIHGEA